MGNQSKLGSRLTYSGREGRFIRRRRRILWKSRDRIRPDAVPRERVPYVSGRSKYQPHEGRKQRRRAMNSNRRLAGMKTL